MIKNEITAFFLIESDFQTALHSCIGLVTVIFQVKSVSLVRNSV